MSSKIMKIPKQILKDISLAQKPLIIGVSGFGGSGKSTFAHILSEEIGIPVIGVDHFMKDRTDTEYHLWDAVDFFRLESEVLKPFLNGEAIEYGTFDWDKNSINGIQKIGASNILIVEGVGLFRPEINEYLNYKIWINTDLETSIHRGKKRDREVHKNEQAEKWDGVWRRNDKEYFDTYSPKDIADSIVDNNKS